MKVPCPTNANHDTTAFSSRQIVWCHDCRKEHPWPLKPGQLPLIANNRQDRKPQ